MVMKVKELKTLDGLNLSLRTKNYLKSNFDSVDAVIREGRIDAFEQDHGTQLAGRLPKWKSELLSSLREAGFIRPATDFEMTFRVGALYGAIFTPWKENFVASVRQLSNEQYEEFQGLSDECLENLKHSLRDCLTEKEYGVITCRFGLEGDNVMEILRVVAQRFNLSRARIGQIEKLALRKLRYSRNSSRLPVIFDAPSDLEETAESLWAELKGLQGTSASWRADSIIQELNRIRKLPFRHKCKCLKSLVLGEAFIDELNLSPRVYNRLRSAGINTVSDVINWPKKDWLKIRFFGRRALEEVIEKMHSIGYEEFDVVL